MKRITALLLALVLLLPGGSVWADQPNDGIVRLEGADRYETAAEISMAAFGESPIALVASGEQFADALGASALTKTYEAPILLTKRNALPEITATALKELGVDTVYIVGGEGSVSEDVKTELETIATTVNRIEGIDRYATAEQIAAKVAGNTPMKDVYIAFGEDFPDALSAGAPAAVSGRPILYAHKSLPAATKQSLTSMQTENATVVGGDGLIPETVVEELEAMGLETQRLQGTDRYATSVAVAKAEFSGRIETVILASGQTYPDALVGTGLAGKEEAPILLTGSALPKDVKTYLSDLPALKKVIILGGTGTVPEAVANDVQKILNLKKPNAAPVIEGPDTLETTLHDEMPEWWELFKVTDDRDAKEDLELKVETGGLNMSKVGNYEVLLMAKDKDGAETQKSIMVYVRELESINLNNEVEVKGARKDLVRNINEKREKNARRAAVSSDEFNDEVLNKAALLWAEAWAKAGTEDMVAKPEEIDFTPSNVIGHRGYRTVHHAFEAMWAEEANQKKILQMNGSKEALTQVVVGSAIAADTDGTYYWVVLNGNRGNETKPEAERNGVEPAQMKPTITLVHDEIELVRNNDKFNLLKNDIVKVRDPALPSSSQDTQKRLLIASMTDEEGRIISPKDWDVTEVGTFKVVYAVEGYYGVMADRKTLTIRVNPH